MTSFIIEIAGHCVAVSTLFESTRNYCADYLCEKEPEFALCTSLVDLTYEAEKNAREDKLENRPIRHFSDEYLEIIALQRKLAEKLFDYDILLFHGSVVAMDGMGFLFTAKSGTGKSTHTRLWRQLFGERAVMINDDKPFLRINQDRIIAYGSPWNGKHKLGANINAPLKSICILERGEENKIIKIAPQDALYMLLQQSNHPMDSRKMLKFMELIDILAAKVEFYRLECNMEPEAALVAYDTMSRKDNL